MSAVWLAALYCAAVGSLAGQTVNVTGTVSVVRQGRGGARSAADAAVWLTPAGERRGETHRSLPRQKFEMVQKGKRFIPRVLVVPVGSVVDFPNLDPIFHNVFSLFDGKRFDLGLYESGGSHGVTFNRVGTSFIFCNIHPEMSAVIISVDTAYYAVTDRSGQFSIADVPPGKYVLSVWHERGKPMGSDTYPREITVTAETAALPMIRLADTGSFIPPHKNKYGQDYETTPRTPGTYGK